MYISFQVVSKFANKQNSKIYFIICSYILKMTLNVIETLKPSTYRPKHINNMKIHFQPLTNLQQIENTCEKQICMHTKKNVNVNPLYDMTESRRQIWQNGVELFVIGHNEIPTISFFIMKYRIFW